MEHILPFEQLLDDVNQMIQVSDLHTFELLYANKAAINYGGIPRGDFTGQKCYHYMMNLDEPCSFCPMRQAPDIMQESIIDNSKQVLSVKTKLISWDGHDAFMECATDITAEYRAKEFYEKAVTADSKFKRLYDTVECGIFEYTLDGDHIHFLNLNPAALRMLGYTAEEFQAQEHWTLSDFTHPDERTELHTLFSSVTPAASLPFSVRSIRKNGHYFWLTGHLHCAQKNGVRTYLTVCMDVDAQKQAELELRAERRKMDIAMSHSFLSIWDYDIATHRCTQSESQQNIFDIPKQTSVSEILESGKVHPDSMDAYRKLYTDIDAGALLSEQVIQMFLPDGTSRWFKFTLQRTEDTDAAPSVIGWSIDITESMRAQERLRAEIRYQTELVADNLIAKARFNLTRNKVEAYTVSDNIACGYAGESYEDWIEALLNTVVMPEQRTALSHIILLSSALQNFIEGNVSDSVDYQRRLQDGRQIWTRTTIRLYRDASTGDIMSFVYTYDIDMERIMQSIVHCMDKTNSEFLAVIYPENEQFKVIHSSRTLPSKIDPSYSKNVKSMVLRYLSPEYQTEAEQKFSLTNIIHQLEHTGTYTIAFPVNTLHDAKRKKWDFYYLDESKTAIVINRTDITAIFAQQEKQKEILESALLAAKQASAAKTAFLSRMSHEIRTPMNAILGMCTLAAQAMGNDEEVSDCISKIGISGHYLLTLINDILDMSRIESGKMLLHKEVFRMDELVSSINTIIYGQAEDNGIDYETIVDSNLEEAYIGDAMKIQQIMVNILGNAVKFTHPGGKITFSIHTTTARAKMQKLTFKINDTGCGIKESDIHRIFEAFEQADNTNTSEFSGTGLGLAISKNLVELMDGTIQCRSIVDIGTEFTVRIPIEVSISKKPVKKSNYSFQKMHTLIVDDDIVICESTARTLTEIGMIPEWVVSGPEAIQKVQSWHDSGKAFDYILIDWKMPEMDGIETARQIRAIVGPNVTIIIITAYDWISIEREAKQAGVNMCISKPMFKSTLISAFEKAQQSIETEKQEQKIISYDFTGLRFLLAEDHPMNAEIAKKLLESKHCTVELAENGLRALEEFSTNPVGYYDAILMDVRMPIMDGLQATSTIRRWHKEDAKTIPIIAMTANAFDEDVEKCMEAGMNAHIAKPIEPSLLFHTIQRLVQSDC